MQHETLKLKQQFKELQERYDVQLSQINSLIFENHRLKQELGQFKEERSDENIIMFK